MNQSDKKMSTLNVKTWQMSEIKENMEFFQASHLSDAFYIQKC